MTRTLITCKDAGTEISWYLDGVSFRSTTRRQSIGGGWAMQYMVARVPAVAVGGGNMTITNGVHYKIKSKYFHSYIDCGHNKTSQRQTSLSNRLQYSRSPTAFIDPLSYCIHGSALITSSQRGAQSDGTYTPPASPSTPTPAPNGPTRPCCRVPTRDTPSPAGVFDDYPQPR